MVSAGHVSKFQKSDFEHNCVIELKMGVNVLVAN